MNSDICALLEVQALDVLADKVVARLGELNRCQLIESKLATAQRMLAKIDEESLRADVQAKDLDLQVQSLDEKIKACDKRLYGGTVTNPKELTALEKELAALKDKRKRMDDELLPMMEAANAVKTRKEELLKAVETLKQKKTECQKLEAKERAQLQGKLKLIGEKRARHAAKVCEKSMLSRYESVRGRTKGAAISKVQGGRCDACRVVVPSNALHRLTEPGHFEGCENCGRILVMGQ
jgi:uncharacterized protein